MLLLVALTLLTAAQKDARVTPGAAAAKPTPTVVTSERLDMDYAKNVAHFAGNVHVKDPSGDLWSDEMEIHYDPKNREIRELVATGKKVVTRTSGKRSVSKKAVYTAADGKIVLTGDPRIIQGRNVYAADTIIIFKDTEKTIFEPRARLVLYSDEGHDALEDIR